jgi:hypothetical protein
MNVRARPPRRHVLREIIEQTVLKRCCSTLTHRSRSGAAPLPDMPADRPKRLGTRGPITARSGFHLHPLLTR